MYPELRPRSPLEGRRILLVEDNRVHRELAGTILERLGCVVTAAMNGQEALVKLEAEPFYLVLMDIEMPWMNGIRAAEEIRARITSGTLSDVPILALTADISEETAQRCIDAGMLDVIPKHIWKPRWEQIIVEKLSRWM
jgi:CheY-like chemotaxis protein